MKKIKLFLCVALFGAMSFGVFSAYKNYTMSEEKKFLLANVEALTSDTEGPIEDWWGRKDYICLPQKCYRYFIYTRDGEYGKKVENGQGTVAHSWDCDECFPEML